MESEWQRGLLLFPALRVLLSDPAVVFARDDGIFYGWRLYLKRPYKRFLVIYIYESPLLCRAVDDWRNCHRLSGAVDFMAVKI